MAQRENQHTKSVVFFGMGLLVTSILSYDILLQSTKNQSEFASLEVRRISSTQERKLSSGGDLEDQKTVRTSEDVNTRLGIAPNSQNKMRLAQVNRIELLKGRYQKLSQDRDLLKNTHNDFIDSIRDENLIDLNPLIDENKEWRIVPSLKASTDHDGDNSSLFNIDNYSVVPAVIGGRASDLDVVYNSENKSYGVVTGLLIVTLYDFNKRISLPLAAAIQDTAPHLRTAFIKTESANRTEFIKQLQTDPNVESVRYEIVSRMRIKN